MLLGGPELQPDVLDVPRALDHGAHLLGDTGRVMPRFALNSTCFARRRSVSSIARFIESVSLSRRGGHAVQMARGATYGLDHERSERRNPSLSASRIATSDTSAGRAFTQQVDADEQSNSPSAGRG